MAGCKKDAPLQPEREVRMRLADVPVAILAGGLATRLRPITEKLPKALIEVAGRPFVEHQLELLRTNGVRKVVLCVGFLGEQIEERVGNGSTIGMEVRYSYDGDRLLGTGGALRHASSLLGPLFWVLYGDSYLEVDYALILDHFLGTGALGLMTVLENRDRWDQSNLVFSEGRVRCYSKQRHISEMKHIDYGLSLLRAEALQSFPEHEHLDLADLFGKLVNEGRIAAYEVHRRFYEIGSHRGFQETETYLLSRGLEQRDIKDGRKDLHANAAHE
jgi:NDP-sugar pyrophosphorylase family protein